MVWKTSNENTMVNKRQETNINMTVLPELYYNSISETTLYIPTLTEPFNFALVS